MRSIPVSIILLLLWGVGFAGPMNETVNRHTADQERLDSLSAALPFLMDKVQSTIEGASSEPVSFHGEVQFRGQWHNYTNLADSSYLLLAKSAFQLGSNEPVIKLGMVVRPGRNTTLWAKMGVSASYYGTNTDNFLKGTVASDPGYSYAPTHHDVNRQVSIFEDLSAGIAIRTRAAAFQLQMGAMNWSEASPLSIWKAQPRIFAWHYLPYEIEQPIARYYEYNIAKGVKQGQAAWNKKAFQGINFSVENAPFGLGGYFLFGSGMPFNKYERSHMDMAIDLGYAADEGSIVETGIGDSYNHNLFYRITKKVGPTVTVGFNNGYIYGSKDVTEAGYTYENTWNKKFDVGRYNSTWEMTNGTTVKVNDATTYNQVAADAGAVTTSLGEGYYIEPRTFSIDGRGKIGERWSFMADVGVAYVDTTWLTMDTMLHPENTGTLNDITSNIFSEIYGNDPPYPEVGTMAQATGIKSSRQTRSSADVAVFLSGEYNTPKIGIGLDFLYAGKGYYAPFSFVNSVDAYWAMGSNLVDVGNFINSSEASPYSNNMTAAELTVTPKLPWYGHLRLKYGNTWQNTPGQDIIFLPYRLNGSQFHSTLNNWYSKWGLGTLTSTYDFNNNQGRGSNPSTGDPSPDVIAKHPLYRVADQSFAGEASQVSGGLRSDGHALFEGFVPYSDPKDVIFNWFSSSTVVDPARDLSSIWDQGSQGFVDVRGNVDSVMIVEGVDTSYYTLVGDDLTIRDAGGAVISTEAVSTSSASGFVPNSSKRSFRLAADWAMDLGEYIGYDHDFFLSLYYEVSGVTKKYKPLAFNSDDDDVLLLSHYIRSEPAIAITDKFYIIGLFGWEYWNSGKTWAPILDETTDALIGFEQSELKTTDVSWGLGFDWDMLKRVSLHARYTWFRHKDEQLTFNNFDGHAVAFEIKAFF